MFLHDEEPAPKAKAKAKANVAVIMTLVASILASTGESFLIGGNEPEHNERYAKVQKVSNRYGDACGNYYPALPSILSSPKKQDEHNVSSAYNACLSVHFDEIAWRTAIRYNRNPSRTVINYQEQRGRPPHPRLSEDQLHQSNEEWAIYSALELREEVDGELPKSDTFYVYYAGKNKTSDYKQNESFAKEK